ncbi:ultraviolet-B receptor UVR8 [Sitophilus oryzae]|uniref:Ultraviolet-B receptor UVR8 n=1 Tax=Sitophilus oryzae TaxID=7048 RepID=A0A6J2XFM6_SITOR|nr:ultraviolet-B receptor UVR8 [Sitophilus oryzae]
MRIFCRGFNLYNQLNSPEVCVEEFEPTIEEDSIQYFEIKHSFSVIVSNDIIKVFCNCLENNVVDCKRIQDIKCITANEDAVIVANSSGQLYKISVDDLNQISLLPKFIDDNRVVRMLSCGAKLNIAYTSEGLLYTIPEKVNFKSEDIVEIKTGREHCLLLDKLGNVYSFGRGSRGQLGLGELEDELTPQLIEALAGIKIATIAAGGWHSAAVSAEGDLYIWGWNGNGQLGLTEPSDKDAVQVLATPQVVDIKDCSERQVVKVACGYRHTIILLDNNHLYGSGWNKYKQLKKEEEENFHKFTFIHDFSNEVIEKILCGSWMSAVICK